MPIDFADSGCNPVIGRYVPLKNQLILKLLLSEMKNVLKLFDFGEIVLTG